MMISKIPSAFGLTVILQSTSLVKLLFYQIIHRKFIRSFTKQLVVSWYEVSSVYAKTRFSNCAWLTVCHSGIEFDGSRCIVDSNMSTVIVGNLAEIEIDSVVANAVSNVPW